MFALAYSSQKSACLYLCVWDKLNVDTSQAKEQTGDL